MKIRDRIKELRRVKASELRPNPRNWRSHPQAQQDALRGVLAEVGWADAALAREEPGGDLVLLDGHLRGDVAGDEEIPVLVLDVTAEEGDKILATLDPLAAMAEADGQKLGELLASIETENEGLQSVLDGLASEHGIDLFESGAEEDEPDTSEQLGDAEYRLVLLCDSEEQQRELLTEFEKRGLECQALIS
jgi:hypothetical protein